MGKNKDIALCLAEMGFFVFPCQAGGERAKSPMPGIKWRQASTQNPAQIKKWWQSWPGAAAGLDLAKSGHLVIDCDRHSADADGVKVFEGICEAAGWDINQSPLIATPSGGRHVYFRQKTGPTPFGNGKGMLPPGIDVRGHGGYVIAPGSAMVSGGYGGFPKDLTKIPVVPYWLSCALLTPPPTVTPAPAPAPRTRHSDARIEAYCSTAIAEELGRVAGAPQGERNNTLNASAFALGQLVGAGWQNQSEMVAQLLSAAQQAGLSAAEARQTILSGIKAGSGEPRQLADNVVSAEEFAEQRRIANAMLTNTLAKRQFAAAEEARIAEEYGEVVNFAPAPIAQGNSPTQPINSGETGGIKVEREPLGYPDGLVGDIARWTAENSIFPQPELAVLVGLSVIATAAGRQFTTPVKNGAIGLYTLGLAPTGSGKEDVLQAGRQILKAAGLAKLFGAPKFHSASAVFNFLLKKPLSICYMDEFGQWLKEINNRRASSALAAVPGVLRSIWGMHFNSMETPEGVASSAATIEAPALSLFCVSTPQQFWDGINGAALEDGTLNRFLLLEGRSAGEENFKEAAPVPEEIIKAVKIIHFYGGELIEAWRGDASQNPLERGAVVKLGWCPDGAEAAWQAFAKKYRQEIRQNEEKNRFYGRTAEMALRIASIIAIGRLEDNQVRMADLRYGMRLAEMSAQLMESGAADYMAENENQANAQKIIRALKRHGGKMTQSQLYRSLQNAIKARDLRDILQLLIESAQIERLEQKTKGRSSFVYKLI